jgi:hypothetical protein
MEKLKAIFKLTLRQGVDTWGYETEMPVYDGLHLYTTEKNPRHVGRILWDPKVENCYLQLDTDEELDDFIDSYETFKEFCATIKLAKFHIRLAHEDINIDSSDDEEK